MVLAIEPRGTLSPNLPLVNFTFETGSYKIAEGGLKLPTLLSPSSLATTPDFITAMYLVFQNVKGIHLYTHYGI